MKVTMQDATFTDQLYYVSKMRGEDTSTDEVFGYVSEAMNSAKPYDYTETHFEPYQHDYSKYPESRQS